MGFPAIPPYFFPLKRGSYDSTFPVKVTICIYFLTDIQELLTRHTLFPRMKLSTLFVDNYRDVIVPKWKS
jgi:hypothetical protein